MTVQEIVNKVIAERQTPGRFPARLIFARNFLDYGVLVDELSKICEVTLNLATFTEGDIFPNFNALKRELLKHANKRILLLSLGEYLRLCAKRECNRETSVFTGLWETMQSENETTKYIMPLLGGRELLNQVVPIVDERQNDFLWDLMDLSDASEFTVNVYSTAFATAVKTDANSFREWLERWDTLYADRYRNSFSLTSKLVEYSTPIVGIVSVKIIKEPFAYVTSLISDGQKLKREWGDELFWTNLSKHVKQGEGFASTVRNVLNMGTYFDPVVVLARFAHLLNFERCLLWIWYKLISDNSYYSFAICKAAFPDEIPTMLRDAIFELPKVPDSYLADRANALKVLDVQFGHEYFFKLDKVLPAETRLSYLTYKTLEERAYAIKIVSNLLRAGADMNEISKQFHGDYPDFEEYLCPSNLKSDEVTRYFNWYRQSKIMNRQPEDWPNYIDFDGVDSRNKIMQQYGDVRTLWVDGLGAEWISLLVKKLKQIDSSVKVNSNIGRAILPSETEYNHKWRADDEKWDRLDSISHSGMADDKDYFLCIARQIDIIGEVVVRVTELLSRNESVIITGDHGSSRLAALMFHSSNNYAIDPPKNSIVRSFGRFCELNGSADIHIIPSMEQIHLDKKEYIVMKTYEHFKQSGNAAGGNSDEKSVAGEVHGGMTPEEYLVPVIIVKREVQSEKPNMEEEKKSKVIKLNNLGI